MTTPLGDLELKDIAKLVYLDIQHSRKEDTHLFKLYKIKNPDFVTLGDVADYYQAKGRFEGITEGIEYLREKYTEEEFNQWMAFLDKIDRNPEYRQWKITNVESKNLRNESGFVAFTVDTGDAKIIAFRGSEDIFNPEYNNDWINNFRTTYETNDQQKDAMAYIRQYLRADQVDKLYLTGHSLGGNLALFASFNLPEDLRGKLVSVTTFNAPGFNREVLGDYAEVIGELDGAGKIREYQNIKDFVPALLYNPTKGILIETAAEGGNPFDHHGLDAYAIENGELVVADSQSRPAYIQMIHTVTTDFESLPKPLKAYAVQMIFKVWNGRWDLYDLAAVVIGLPLVPVMVSYVLVRFTAIGHLLPNILPLIQTDWKTIELAFKEFQRLLQQWGDDFAKWLVDTRKLVRDQLTEFRDRAIRAATEFLDWCKRMLSLMRDFGESVIRRWQELRDRVIQSARKAANKAIKWIRREGVKIAVKGLRIVLGAVRVARVFTPAGLIVTALLLVAGAIFAVYKSRMKANLDRLDEVWQKLRSKQDGHDVEVERLLDHVMRLAEDVERRYSEWHVRSAVGEVEDLCRKIRRENRELGERVRKMADGLKYAAKKYRETENRIVAGTGPAWA